MTQLLVQETTDQSDGALRSSEIGAKAVVGAAWLSVGQFISSCVSLVAAMLLARMLVPDDFGAFALVLSLVEMLYILAGWGFSIAIVQCREERPTLYDTVFSLTLVLGLLVGAAASATAVFLVHHYQRRLILMFLLLSWGRVLPFLAYSYSAVMERRLEFRWISVVNISANISGALVALGFAALGAGVWSLIGREILAGLVSFLGMRHLSRWRFRLGMDRGTAQWLFGFGLKNWLANLSGVLFHRLDNLVVGTYAGVTSLGLYSQAYLLSEVGLRFGAPVLSYVPFAMYSAMQDDRSALSRSYRMINFLIIRLLFGVGLLYLLLAEDLIRVILGTQWLAATPIVRVLTFYAMAIPILEHIKSLLYAKGALSQFLRIRAIQLSVFLPLLYYAVKHYGAVGAAWAVDAGIFVGLVLGYLNLRRHVDISLRDLLAAPLLAAAASVAAFFAGQHIVNGLIGQSWVAAFLLQGVVLLGTYTAVLMLVERDDLRLHISTVVELVRRRQPITTSRVHP